MTGEFATLSAVRRADGHFRFMRGDGLGQRPSIICVLVGNDAITNKVRLGPAQYFVREPVIKK